MVLSLIGQFIVSIIAIGYFSYALHKEGFIGLALIYLILFILLALSIFGQILVQAGLIEYSTHALLQLSFPCQILLF